MSTTSEQHAEHLDREQAEGDLAEELAQAWWDALGFDPAVAMPCECDDPGCRDRVVLSLAGDRDIDPPPSPEDEETLPEDPERTAA